MNTINIKPIYENRETASAVFAIDFPLTGFDFPIPDGFTKYTITSITPVPFTLPGVWLVKVNYQ